jgi:signal transduction histidine kinase
VWIEDDGIGADPARTGAGLGLIGMRERMEAVGGALLVGNRPAGGFSLRADVPVESAA